MSTDKRDHTVMASVTVADKVGDKASGDRPEAEPSSLVGRYRVARRIGKGGMGEVMGARDEQVGRDVAIKRMRKANPSERAIARFLREASIQGRLEHPAICPVHEIGRDGEGLPFFVMKKLSGTTLAKILDRPGGDRGEYPLQRVLRAFAEVCLAIEFAHVRGIVHRDLKPDNIMLGDFGEVYVLDWGVAKVIGEEEDFADVDSGSGEHATQQGTAIGTPGYMAPEQVQGKPVDGKCDVYTLGCLLFEILAGEPLHPRGFDGMSSAVQGKDARPSTRAGHRDIAPELDALCVESTQYDPTKRPSARELGDRVQRFLDGDRDLALRRELARAHLEKATAAFEATKQPEPPSRQSYLRFTTQPPRPAPARSDDGRATAMREAAAAMALDPSLPGPAELVGRLMLEPPTETPREVLDAIKADDIQLTKFNAQAGIWTLVASLAYTPFMWWIAPSASIYVAALTMLFLVNLVALLHANMASKPRPGFIVVGNTLIVLLVARMFSPLLIAPGVAAVLAMAMVLTPKFSFLGSATTVAIFLLVAVLGPLALERLDVVSSTMSVTEAGILFNAPAIAGYETPTILVGTFYTIALIIGSCAMAGTMRRRARDAYRHLQLQAWQLRQLVPRAS